MEATITGENEERVGLSVIDNAGNEHLIEMELDGEIKYHESDSYPEDPSERSDEDERHLQEAQGYARYHVYRNRGYNTFLEGTNPDRLALAALAIAALPDDSLDGYFGDLYRQIKSHYTGDEGPLGLPDGLGEENPTIYMQDIYLRFDPINHGAIAEAMSDGTVLDLLEAVPSLTTRGRTRGFADLQPVISIAEAHDLLEADGQPFSLDRWIDSVSGLHLKWRNQQGNQFEMGDQPDLNREYDARLEVRPFDPEDLDEFRNSLVYNLKCQIRDRFVEYGTNPPKGVQVTGPGADEWTVTYIQVDLLQDYHDPSAEVDWDIENWPDRAVKDEDDGGLF